MINEYLMRAYYFAQTAHNGQTYAAGNEPFTNHLREVVDEARKNYSELVMAMGESVPDMDIVETVAWLHDTIEDTDTTKEILIKNFTPDIAAWVDNVSDAEGTNRKEKKRNTWHKIRSHPVSIFIKLCDRTANTRRSIGTKFEDMYRKEFPLFEAALYVPGQFEKMWAELKELTYDKS